MLNKVTTAPARNTKASKGKSKAKVPASGKAAAKAPSLDTPSLDSLHVPLASATVTKAETGVPAPRCVKTAALQRTQKELDAFGHNLRKAPLKVKNRWAELKTTYPPGHPTRETFWEAVKSVYRGDWSGVEMTMTVEISNTSGIMCSRTRALFFSYMNSWNACVESTWSGLN